MRIAFVSPTASDLFADTMTYTGGAEIQQFLLAQALARRGYEPVFVVAERPGLRGGPIRCLPVRFPLSARSPLERADCTRALWEALVRADARVYVQQGSGLITLEVALFARATGRRFAYIISSDEDWSNRLFPERRFRHALFRRGARWADALVAQTERQREQVAALWGLPARVIRGGVAIAPPPDWSLKKRAVLWVGTLRWFKRPELLLNLADRLPDVAFWVAGGPWIGGGDRDARTADRFRTQAAGRPNIHPFGLLTNDRVLSLQRQAALLVNTSVLEGFPQTFLEAWASRAPVVTCGVDPDEVICRHGLGLHAAREEDLAPAVRRLIDDDPLRRAMGDRCAKHVREHHDIEDIADRYASLFEELTGRRPSAPGPAAGARGFPPHDG
jgi:glycosyltransferase involved in cell wall biosynthesis